MLILPLMLALAADQAPIAGTAGKKDQPGPAAKAEVAGRKSTALGWPAPPCNGAGGRIVDYSARPEFKVCVAEDDSVFPLLPGIPQPKKEGVGAYPASSRNILDALRVRPLDRIGGDVIRFSFSHPVDGGGWVVELHRDEQSASGTRMTLPRRSPGSVVEQAVTMRISMSRSEYDVLAAQIDFYMGLDEPDLRPGTVCLDSPEVVTERRRDGISNWRSGWCGYWHPNKTIEYLMAPIGIEVH